MGESLYILSPTPYSGKTAICLGLSMLAKERGLKVGYFKPIGLEMVSIDGCFLDEDAILMMDILKMEYDVDTITPIMVGSRYLDDYRVEDKEKYLEKIGKAYEKISLQTDLTFIEGVHHPSVGMALGLSAIEIAKYLNARMLYVANIPDDFTLDLLISNIKQSQQNNVDVLGVIINNVSLEAYQRIKGIVADTLEKHGIKIWGIIREVPELTAPTAREIYEALGGEILTGEEYLDRMIEDILIGAMTEESAFKYLRRAVNKAVITGGDRTDIALAAIETDTSLLILTGNLYPNEKVLTAAQEKGTTVLLVPHDTYTTVTLTNRVTGRIKPRNEKRIKLAKKVVKENTKWEEILQQLGLKA